MTVIIDSDQAYKATKLPTVTTSEKKIAQDAPRAIAMLEKMGATDLVEILGVTQFAKEG